MMAWMLAIQFKRGERYQTMAPFRTRRNRDEAWDRLLCLPGLKVKAWRETPEEEDRREQQEGENALIKGKTHL
jgi:hypothetical protein